MTENTYKNRVGKDNTSAMKAKKTRKVLTSIRDNNLRDHYQTEFLEFLQMKDKSHNGTPLSTPVSTCRPLFKTAKNRFKDWPSAKTDTDSVNNQHRTDRTDRRFGTDEDDRRDGTDISEKHIWNVPANLPQCTYITESRRKSNQSKYRHGTDKIADRTTDETVNTDHRHKTDTNYIREEIDKNDLLPLTDDDHPNDLTGESTKSNFSSREGKNKLGGIPVKGETSVESCVPVACVLCDGEVYELVSPSELRNTRARGCAKIPSSQRGSVSDNSVTESTGDTDTEIPTDDNDPDFQPEKYPDLPDHKPEPEAMTFIFVDKRGRSVYQCKRCDRIIAAKWQARRHSQSHSKRTCAFCKKQFVSIQGFQGHVQRRHTEEGKKSSLKTGQYTCSVCYKVFKFFAMFKNHLVRHTESRRFPCADCSQNFHTFSQWCEHRLRAVLDNRTYSVTELQKRVSEFTKRS